MLIKNKSTNFLVVFLSLTLTQIVPMHGYCWNALGHRLIAQIAYNQLTPSSKKIYNKYNRAMDQQFRPQSLVNAAAWLDRLRDNNKPLFAEKHYIDMPFSFDNTPLIPPQKVNAVSAIMAASKVLKEPKASDFERGFALRLLLHVVGDLHQPLHAANQFSRRNPHGDRGGNLFFLSNNPVALNLHAYWDRGGGLLVKNIKYKDYAKLNKKAHAIEKHYPCDTKKMNLNPRSWADESHSLAVKYAYQLTPGTKPNPQYQHIAKELSEKRIALAACRLGALLNELASY